MKKTRSTIQLRCSSPMSVRKEPQAERLLSKWPRLATSKSIATLTTCNLGSRMNRTDSHENLRSPRLPINHMGRVEMESKTQSQSVREKVSLLHERIDKLEK